MEFHEHLFLSRNMTSREAAAVKRQIAKGQVKAPYFVVALSGEPHNELVIYPAYEVRSARVNRDSLVVVGIAKGYFHSLALVTRMAEEVYAQTNDAGMRSWFLQRR